MVILTWILLILNSLAGVISFINIFTGYTIKERVTNGVQFALNLGTAFIFLSYLHII